MTEKLTLQEYFKSLENKPVKWGVNDCTQFIKNIIEIEFGLTIDGEKYKTKKQAYELIQNHGGVVGLYDYYLLNNSFFKISDIEQGAIAVFENEQGGLTGIYFILGNVAVCRTQNGVLFFVPKLSKLRAIYKYVN